MTEKTLARKQKRHEKFLPVIVWNLLGEPPKEEAPKIGETYYAYDGGKVKLSREYRVKITGSISSKELNKKIRKAWETEVISCYWLYAPYEDTIYYGNIVGEDTTAYFCKTKDGGWYGFYEEPFPTYSGRLDTTGYYYKLAHNET